MKTTTKTTQILLSLVLVSCVFFSCPPDNIGYTIENDTKNDLKVVFTEYDYRYQDSILQIDTIIDKYILESGSNYPIFTSYTDFFNDILTDSIQNYFLEIYTDTETYAKDVYDEINWDKNKLIVVDEDLE